MKNLHAKSFCCQRDIRHFGGRRRQCSSCRKTWTSRPKRRGRKRQRGSRLLLQRYLTHTALSPNARAKLSGQAPDHFEAKLRRSRDLFLRTTAWPTLPTTFPIIAIVDAVLKRFAGRFWTLYCIFLRRPNESRAVIVEPYLLFGRETQPGWREAFERLPVATRRKIKAVVCDGHRGPVNYAKQHEWLIQRCHFHLLAAIQGRRSRGRKSRHSIEGQRIYSLVKRCLETADEAEAKALIYQIDDESLNTKSPQLRIILRGFVNYYEDYRQYCYHPDLHLPTTSNAAESFIGSIEELCHRARGFVSPATFQAWIFALAKLKQTITCNGRNQQN